MNNMEQTENMRPQLLADMNNGFQSPRIIGREVYENLAQVTRSQLLADIGEGAINTWLSPFMRYAAHAKRRRDKKS